MALPLGWKQHAPPTPLGRSRQRRSTICTRDIGALGICVYCPAIIGDFAKVLKSLTAGAVVNFLGGVTDDLPSSGQSTTWALVELPATVRILQRGTIIAWPNVDAAAQVPPGASAAPSSSTTTTAAEHSSTATTAAARSSTTAPSPTSDESGRYAPVYGGCILVHAGSDCSSYAGLAASEQLGTFGAGLGVACWLLLGAVFHSLLAAVGS